MMESEKNKLETDEKKLDNHHDDADCSGNKIWYKVLWRELKKQAKKIVNSEADADSAFDKTITRHIKQILDNNTEVRQNHRSIDFYVTDVVKVSSENQKRDICHKIETLVQACIDLYSNMEYTKPLIPAYSLLSSIPNQLLASRGIMEQFLEKEMYSYTLKCILLASRGIMEQFLEKEMYSYTLKCIIYILPDEVKRKFINMSKSIHSEDSLANFKLLADITTSSDYTGEEPIECRRDNESVHLRQKRNGADILSYILCSVHQFWMKKQDNVTHFNLLHEFTPLLGKTVVESIEFDNTMDGVRCKCESTKIKLYRNIIRNETCRMMTSIDMVVTEAKHLFGLERTRIFFDLLDELFYFGSAGAISDFVPNMAESHVRQHVISFFEYACDMMNRLMTMLLGYPDSKRSQKMPEKTFISLMKSVIVSSSLKTETKGEKPSSKVTKGTKLIMVDSDEFERAVGEDISEDVSDRLRRGDKMIVHRFVDTRLEKPQPSDRREKKPIHSIYFPSDCRLFIYIPTENGSYWHQSDMRRASRIHRNVKQIF